MEVWRWMKTLMIKKQPEGEFAPVTYHSWIPRSASLSTLRTPFNFCTPTVLLSFHHHTWTELHRPHLPTVMNIPNRSHAPPSPPSLTLLAEWRGAAGLWAAAASLASEMSSKLHSLLSFSFCCFIIYVTHLREIGNVSVICILLMVQKTQVSDTYR